MRSALAVAGISAGSLIFGLGVGRALNALIEHGRWDGNATHPPHGHTLRPWAVMMFNAVAFLIASLEFGLTWRLLLTWSFIAVMIAIAFIDLERMIIPNRIVVPSALVLLGASVALEPHRWGLYVVAGLGAAFFLFLLALLWRGGMGAGDVKMALLMGAVLGALVIVALFLAFILGAVVGLILIVTKRKSRKDAIPFGPYLAFASVISILVGDRVLQSYLSLMR